MTHGNNYKILLVGDSVFDNVPYVEDGKDTVSVLKRELQPVAMVDSVAVDGYTTIEVLFQLIEGVLKDKPKYDLIFLSIGGNDLLVNQEVYLDQSVDPEERVDFLGKLQERFSIIYNSLKEMSSHVYWLEVYRPYFDRNMFDDDYIRLAGQAISEVNNWLKVGRNSRHMISTSSIVSLPEDFTQVIEPSAIGSEKLAEELKRVVCGFIDKH